MTAALILCMNTFDESKVRRGQPGNRGQFTAKHNSAPTATLDVGFGVEGDYEDPFGSPGIYTKDDLDFDAPEPAAPAPAREPVTMPTRNPAAPKTRRTPRKSNVIPIGNGIGHDRMRELALEAMGEHGLIEQGWTFEFKADPSGKVMGQCNYREKKITVGANYANHAPLEHARDTIHHEIAHALTPGAGHGPRWKSKARSLGARPSPSNTNPYVEYKQQQVMENSYALHADAPEPDRYQPGTRVTVDSRFIRDGSEFAGKTFVVWKHARKNVVISSATPFSNGATQASIPAFILKAERE